VGAPRAALHASPPAGPIGRAPGARRPRQPARGGGCLQNLAPGRPPSPRLTPPRPAPPRPAGRRPSLDCAAHRPEQQPGEWDSPWEWGDFDAAAAAWAPPGTSAHPAQTDADDRAALVFYPSSQQLDLTFRAPAAPAPRAAPAAPRDGTCHVILFGVGEEHTEGIYTLRTQDFVGGDLANVDTVVAFEAAVDAERFATMLEASLGHEPTVFPIAWADITEWCDDNDTRCRLEPAGSLIMPPSSNLGVTDWERLLSLRRNQYQVLEEEPALGAPALAPGFFIDGPDWVYGDEVAAGAADLGNIVDSKLQEKPIDAWRLQFERLVQQ
jgi:hypothetical protein